MGKGFTEVSILRATSPDTLAEEPQPSSSTAIINPQAVSIADTLKEVRSRGRFRFSSDYNGNFKFAPSVELQKYEYYRLASFFQRREDGIIPWHSSFISPISLAKNGFIYTGNDDCVACYWCRVSLNNWIPGDDPLVDHQRWGWNHCPFVLNFIDETMNVPLIIPEEKKEEEDEKKKTEDETEKSSTEDITGLVADLSLTSSLKPVVNTCRYLDGEASSALPLRKWKQVRFNLEEDDEFALPVHLRKFEYHRLASFYQPLQTSPTWSGFLVSAWDLAKNGFFRSGNKLRDAAVCHWCGIVLQDWTRGDEPEVEHKGWAPDCPFVLKCFGDKPNIPIPNPIE